MDDFLEEMHKCKSVKACIELALTDAYGEYEGASAWLVCIETPFERFDRVKLMGEEVALEGFDLEKRVDCCSSLQERQTARTRRARFRRVSGHHAH